MKAVTVPCRWRDRHHALEINTIDLLQEYLQKVEHLGEAEEDTLREGLRRCNYILEIMEVSGKLEFNLSRRINRPAESVFQLIYKYLLQDTAEYLSDLCSFVHKYSPLIL